MNHGVRAGLAALAFFTVAAAVRTEASVHGPLGEDDVLRRVTTAATEKPREGIDARVVFDGLFVTVRDGKAEVRRQRITRLDTEWSWDEAGDPRLSWDRRRQELVIHASRTYLPQGIVLDTPENGFNDVTPDGIDRSVDHLDLREMVVTHVGLEPGAIVFLDWTVRDTVPASAPFDLVVFPHERFPVAERVIVAEGVAGEVVSPADALFPIAPLQEVDSKLIWSGTELAVAPHPRGERGGDQLPWIALSSAGEWEIALASVARDLETAIAAREGVPEMLAGLEEEEPLLTEREWVAACSKRIADRTALLSRDPWGDLRVPRTVAATLARSGASPLERCAILLAGCREKQLESAVVVPARGTTISRHVPALEMLRDPLVLVRDAAGGAWWADPVAATVSASPPFPPGAPYFVLTDAGVTRDRQPPDTSVVEIAVFRDLVSGRAKCEGRITGPAASRLDLTRPESLVREWVAGWSDSTEVDGVRVVESVAGRFSFAVSATAPLPAEDRRGRIAVTLPLAPLDVAALLPAGADVAHVSSDRVLFAEAPLRVTVRWRLRVPDDRDVLAPGGTEAACAGGSFRVRREVRGTDVEVVYELTHDGRAVAPAAYPDFRRLALDVVDPRSTTLILGNPRERES